MAHTTVNAPVNAPVTNSIMGAIARFFTGFGAALVRMGESNSKMRQLNALQALSDKELAERGLRRQDIAHYIFSGSYWV